MRAVINKASLVMVVVVALLLSVGASTAAAADPGLTLTATPGTVSSGHAARLTVHIAVPGATLQLSRRYAGESAFTELGSVTAGAAGDLSWSVTPRGSATYRVEFAGNAEWAQAFAEARVEVRPKVTLTASTGDVVFTGGRVTLTVRVAPGRPGGAVEVQRWDSGAGAWSVLTTLTLDGASKARWVWRPSQSGRQKLRARIPADADHVAGVSGTRRLEVFDASSNPYGVPTSFPHLILIDRSQYKLY
jgi:hypothetical protein